jgi:hypothetical protein
MNPGQSPLNEHLVIQRSFQVILHPSSLILRDFAMGDPEDDEEEEEEKKKSEEDEDDEEDDGEEEEETWQVGGARSASGRCAPKG